MQTQIHPASFRDPAGFIFSKDGILYRQVQQSYRPHYEKAKISGLYETLIREGSLIAHEEVSAESGVPGAFKILKPEIIPFISYPYEWCFSGLKNAALLTLKIQKQALDHGMILKDASAYNIQFRGPKPVFIDTLSFEIYEEGKPWDAYRQFCEHFLAPLALMSFCDSRLGSLFTAYPDGIPLDMAARLLPFRTRFMPSLFLSIHLQAKLQLKPEQAKKRGLLSKSSLRQLMAHLESAVQSLKGKSQQTIWGNYRTSESYTEEAAQSKMKTLQELLAAVSFKRAWDLGAHSGVFTEALAVKADRVFAFDADPSATEAHYQKAAANTLPLVMNLTHPSPALGWDHKERFSLKERGPADLLMMLAVIHHLARSHNLPLSNLAGWLAGLTRYAVIEFVPKEDPKVQEILSRRDDIFPEYSQAGFEKAFGVHFRITAKKPIQDSLRILYFLEKL